MLPLRGVVSMRAENKDTPRSTRIKLVFNDSRTRTPHNTGGHPLDSTSKARSENSKRKAEGNPDTSHNSSINEKKRPKDPTAKEQKIRRARHVEDNQFTAVRAESEERAQQEADERKHAAFTAQVSLFRDWSESVKTGDKRRLHQKIDEVWDKHKEVIRGKKEDWHVEKLMKRN